MSTYTIANNVSLALAGFFCAANFANGILWSSMNNRGFINDFVYTILDDKEIFLNEENFHLVMSTTSHILFSLTVNSVLVSRFIAAQIEQKKTQESWAFVIASGVNIASTIAACYISGIVAETADIQAVYDLQLIHAGLSAGVLGLTFITGIIAANLLSSSAVNTDEVSGPTGGNMVFNTNVNRQFTSEYRRRREMEENQNELGSNNPFDS